MHRELSVVFCFGLFGNSTTNDWLGFMWFSMLDLHPEIENLSYTRPLFSTNCKHKKNWTVVFYLKLCFYLICSQISENNAAKQRIHAETLTFAHMALEFIHVCFNVGMWMWGWVYFWAYLRVCTWASTLVPLSEWWHHPRSHRCALGLQGKGIKTHSGFMWPDSFTLSFTRAHVHTHTFTLTRTHTKTKE